jgi:DHA1 family multidrug resistance protein-like MFS transporter
MVIMDNASPSVPWRRNLSALWAVQFASALGFTFTFPFFTLFFQDLGIDDQARAALWGGISGWALGLGLGVFGPIWGVIGDHYGRRINLVRALFLGGVIMVLSAYAQNEYQLVFSRFVTGAASGVGSTILAFAVSTTPRRSQASALGIIQSALFLGTTGGPLFGGIIFDHYGLRPAFFATGGTLIITALVTLAFSRENFQRPIVQPGEKPHPFKPFADLWRLATSRRILPVLFVIFAVHAAMMLTMPVLPVIVESLRPGGDTGTATGLVLLAVGAASAVSSIFTGGIASRFNIRAVLVVWCTVAALLYVPLAFTHSYPLLIILMGSAGLFQGGLAVVANGLLAAMTPSEQQGSAFGAAQTALAGGIAFGPLAGGLVGVWFSLESVFLANTTLLGLTALMGLFFLRIGIPVDEQTTEHGATEAAPGDV